MRKIATAEYIEAKKEMFLQNLEDNIGLTLNQEKAVTVRLEIGLVAEIDALCGVYGVSRQHFLSKLITLEMESMLVNLDECHHPEFDHLYNLELQDHVGVS